MTHLRHVYVLLLAVTAFSCPPVGGQVGAPSAETALTGVLSFQPEVLSGDPDQKIYLRAVPAESVGKISLQLVVVSARPVSGVAFRARFSEGIELESIDSELPVALFKEAKRGEVMAGFSLQGSTALTSSGGTERIFATLHFSSIALDSAELTFDRARSQVLFSDGETGPLPWGGGQFTMEYR